MSWQPLHRDWQINANIGMIVSSVAKVVRHVLPQIILASKLRKIIIFLSACTLE